MSAMTLPSTIPSLRSRIRSVVKSSAEFDVPAPPRPPPPQFVPPFGRDRIYSPRGIAWETLVPDLNVLDGIFPKELQSNIRFLTCLEFQVLRQRSLSHARKYPLPCEVFSNTAFVDRGRFYRMEDGFGEGITYVTVAAYPTWMNDAAQRQEALAELTLNRFGL